MLKIYIILTIFVSISYSESRTKKILSHALLMEVRFLKMMKHGDLLLPLKRMVNNIVEGVLSLPIGF